MSTVVAAEVTIKEPSDVHPTAEIGPGSIVWRFTTVGGGVKTGAYCAIGSNCYIGAGSRLGESVRIQHGVFLPNRSTIGHRVFIGPNVTFTDDKHPKVCNPMYRAQPPVVEDDAAIGAGATILPGVRIGRGATVGAGAVVTKDVPPYIPVAGNPARPLP